MATKYIVQDNKITKVVYIGGCQTAKGGRQKVQEQTDVLQGRNIMDYEEFDLAVAYERLYAGTPIHGQYHEKNYRAREKKRRQTIEELVVNNFEPRNSCMLTLTFSDCAQSAEQYEEIASDDMDIEQELAMMADCLNHPEGQSTVTDRVKIYDPESKKYCDLTYCNKLFKQFIQRMKYRFPLFRYVAVMAQQNNGKWHYHLVCNLNYIPFDGLRTLWGNGAVYFRSFKQTGLNGMWKAVRYLQKNMAQSELKGEKGYLASKGLQRNKVFRSWVGSEKQQADKIEKGLSNLTPSRSYETSHDYEGLSTDGTFGKELTATTKYFMFFQSSTGQFSKLPNAYIGGKV